MPDLFPGLVRILCWCGGRSDGMSCISCSAGPGNAQRLLPVSAKWHLVCQGRKHYANLRPSQALPPSVLDQHAANASIHPGSGKAASMDDRVQSRLCCMCGRPPPGLCTKLCVRLCGCSGAKAARHA